MFYLFISFVYLSTIKAVFLLLICKRELNFLKVSTRMFTTYKRWRVRGEHRKVCSLYDHNDLGSQENIFFLNCWIMIKLSVMNHGNNTIFYLFQCLFANFSSIEKSIIYMSNLCPCVRHWSERVLLHLLSHITHQSQVLPILQGRTLKLRQVKPLVPGYKSFAQDFMVIMWQNQNLGPGGSDFTAQSLFITRRFWGQGQRPSH